MNCRTIKSSELVTMLFAAGRKLSLAVLCSMLMTNTLLAQDTPKDQNKSQDSRPETPLSKGPLPMVRPTAQTDLTVTDDEIVFTSPGFSDYLKAIRLSDNLGYLSIFSTDLSGSPGAAIHLAGNGTMLPGQIYFDSGAHDNAALIFRTAQTGGVLAERMRITANGNVGIGVSDPGARLDVEGNSAGSEPPIMFIKNHHTGTGGGQAIFGETNSQTSSAIFGRALSSDGAAVGVHGISFSTNGIGTSGIAIGTDGNAIGVNGESRSLNGAGGHFANFGGGDLIRGQGTSGFTFRVANNGDVFVRGQLLVPGGVTGSGTSGQIPVWTSSTALGNSVITQSGGNVGIGTTNPSERLHVEGNAWVSGDGAQITINNTSSSRNPGLYLRDASGAQRTGVISTNGGDIEFAPSGVTRMHINNARGNVGIGTTNPTQRLTVAGNVLMTGPDFFISAPDRGAGGIAIAHLTGNRLGINAGNNFSRLDLFGNVEVDLNMNVNGNTTFQRDVLIRRGLRVDGSLSVGGSKSFKIDHPLDPANKYLTHSCVESPDMMNIYNGNAVTDENGDATIILPDYFVALNRDYRYQLTVIGQFAQAIVTSEIADNRFIIKTDKPSVKVSWQVTGVRQDAWAKAHPMVVEEEKPEKERGSYLYSEASGHPEEKGVECAQHPEQMRQTKEEEKRPTAP